MAQWQQEANYVIANWRTFAHWAFVSTLSKPGSKTRRIDNDTLQYVAPIQIKDRNGRIVRTFGSLVSVARKSQNIITAFPTSRLC
jgi:hypothetical protein